MYSKELVIDNLKQLQARIEGISTQAVDRSKVLEILDRVINVVDDIDVTPNMERVEVAKKAVAFLQSEQRNWNYLDPEEGGLYSDEFIEDFEKYINQF